jgi:hypothetical protein
VISIVVSADAIKSVNSILNTQINRSSKTLKDEKGILTTKLLVIHILGHYHKVSVTVTDAFKKWVYSH